MKKALEKTIAEHNKYADKLNINGSYKTYLLNSHTEKNSKYLATTCHECAIVNGQWSQDKSILPTCTN